MPSVTPRVTGITVGECDVAVAGGGLVGLSLAYELITRGASVTVIDAGHPGRATDAGAGILAPATHPATEPFWWEMAHRAGRHYPALLERIAADGVDTQDTAYAKCGLLSIGLRESEDSWFGPFAERVLSRSGGQIRAITPTEAQSLFPPLGDVHRALHYPDAARIDGRGMATALRQAAARRGVRFISGAVADVEGGPPGTTPGRVAQRIHINANAADAAAATSAAATSDAHATTTTPADADLRCGALVIAGGAWSADLGARVGCPLPITPTKGQIVHLDTAHATDDWPIVQPLLTHYLVPWPGGRVACGGTFEPGAGFSATITAAGLHELLRECLAVAPGMADAQYLYARAGLRPTSPDDRPVVGAVPGWRNVWVATGHGANGLLLGPYTASLLAARITAGASGGGVTEDIPAELDPARFF